MTAPKFSILLILSLLASLLLAFWAPTLPPAPPEAKQSGLHYTESKTFEVEWNFQLTNTSASTQSGELHLAKIPQPDDRACHGQTILAQTFNPAPTQELELPDGNACAVYAVPALAPGQSVSITQRARVRLTSINTDLPALSPAPLPSVTPTSTLEQKKAAWSQTWAGTETKLWYRLVRIYDGLRAQRYELESAPRTLTQILNGSALQCQDAARFMTELARYEGCSARQVTGIYLRPEDPHSTTLHAWTEVQLPTGTWVVIDPTMGRFPEERASRLAQLDNYYLTLWHGYDTADICRWIGSPLPIKITFNHRLIERQAHTPQGLTAQPAFQNYLRSWDSAVSPAAVPTLSAADQQQLQAAERALAQGEYSQAEQILANSASGPARLALLIQLYTTTKQSSMFWQALSAKTAYGRERDDLFNALAWCVDCADWDAVELVTRRGLALFPHDVDILIARCHALYRQGGDSAVSPLLERVHTLCRDGYHEAMWGNLCLDDYRIAAAREHWNKALKLGLNPQERAYYEDMLKQTESYTSTK